tara:strand:- start:8 stop:184 length:177 start_codon:yes stop_codon:yes gene_type:complete
MNKIKRPTLATTKNCIMILKEAHARSYRGNNRDRIAMVLTMLTNDEIWLKEQRNRMEK